MTQATLLPYTYECAARVTHGLVCWGLPYQYRVVTACPTLDLTNPDLIYVDLRPPYNTAHAATWVRTECVAWASACADWGASPRPCAPQLGQLDRCITCLGCLARLGEAT